MRSDNLRPMVADRFHSQLNQQQQQQQQQSQQQSDHQHHQQQHQHHLEHQQQQQQLEHSSSDLHPPHHQFHLHHHLIPTNQSSPPPSFLANNPLQHHHHHPQSGLPSIFDLQSNQSDHHHQHYRHSLNPLNHFDHHHHPFNHLAHQYHHQLSSLDLSLRNESENINTSTINANLTRTASNPTTAFNYSQTSFINSDSRLDPIDLNSRPQREHQFDLINQDRAMRYYSPLIESTLIPLPSSSPISYLSLNQKRESVITFNHNQLVANNFNDRSNRSSKHLYSSVVDDDGERDESIGTELDENEFNDDGIVSKTDKDLNRHHQQQQQRNQSDKNLDHNDFKTKLSSTTATPSTPTTISVSSKSSSNKTNRSDDEIRNDEIVLVKNIRLTIDQIICICQILQKSDLKKLEKFVVAIPNSNDVCNRNELILRAKAIAAYHGGNFKQVYHLLEANSFPIKFHQELQSLWNNAHYKEHEMKRGHPPGAVEKYRIRKKYRFPRTIWDGEEYVYCFKEKNRRILKEFYQKCNLPTQEDKLKLSNETQLTVVQISNWFKNRRQRDRQPNHHHHHHHPHHPHQHSHHNHLHNLGQESNDKIPLLIDSHQDDQHNPLVSVHNHQNHSLSHHNHTLHHLQSQFHHRQQLDLRQSLNESNQNDEEIDENNIVGDEDDNEDDDDVEDDDDGDGDDDDEDDRQDGVNRIVNLERSEENLHEKISIKKLISLDCI